MMKRLVSVLALWVTAVGAMGSTCAPQRSAAVSLAPSESVQPWSRHVADWSRAHKVYYWMDDKIFARATYHSPAFRKGFIDHRDEFFGDFSRIAKKELVDLGGGEAENWHSFFVSAYVGTQRYRALAHAATIWTLSIENDEGVRVNAQRLTDVKINPAVQAIYPYVDRFDRAYLVRFPLATDDGRPVITSLTKSVTMRISSAYAEATLIWDLIPATARADFGMPRDGGPPDAAVKDDEGGFGLGKILGG